MTSPIESRDKACSIDQAIKGLPANWRIFFPGTPLDPDLAKMNALIFKK
jgi:hypothetical protein